MVVKDASPPDIPPSTKPKNKWIKDLFKPGVLHKNKNKQINKTVAGFSSSLSIFFRCMLRKKDDTFSYQGEVLSLISIIDDFLLLPAFKRVSKNSIFVLSENYGILTRVLNKTSFLFIQKYVNEKGRAWWRQYHFVCVLTKEFLFSMPAEVQ